MSFAASALFYSLNGATTTTTGNTVDITGFDPNVPPAMQIIISGTATVVIEESLNQANWNTMQTTTASGAWVLPVQGLYYRARVTAFTSGTITAIVGPGVAMGMLAAAAGPLTKSSGPS